MKETISRVGACLLGAALIISIRAAVGRGDDFHSYTGPKRKIAKSETPEFRFEEVSLAAGLTLKHFRNEVAPELANVKPLLSARGASVSVADFNNDGWMDFYYTSAGAGTPNALYRNNGNGTFTNVADSMGVADLNRGNSSMSALWFDYDQDGWKDLYVVAMGCNTLFRNMKGKRFVNVTANAGDITGRPDRNGFCGSPRSALAFDYDRDGDLDVFVANFNPKDWRKIHDGDTAVMHRSAVYDPNGPQSYLFRNNGNGTFSEVAREMGVANYHWAQSAGAGDFNNDGWPDLFVANDVGIDRVFMNKEGNRFEMRPDMLPGVFPRYGMNGDIADFDDDGWVDIFNTKITRSNFTSGTNQLWVNLGGQIFQNQAVWRGVSRCGWAWAGRFVDLASRGQKDLVVVNGLTSGNPNKSYWFFAASLGAMDSYFLQHAKFWPDMGEMDFSGHEKNCVFYRTAGHDFIDMAEAVGIDDDWNGRGLSILDANNDGRPDLLIGNVGERPLLYINKPRHDRAWIGFVLKGVESNRDAIGARVELIHKRSDGTLQKQYWHVSAGNGFASQSDPRLLFGLGEKPVELISAKVLWPSGKEQTLNTEYLKPGMYHRISEHP